MDGALQAIVKRHAGAAAPLVQALADRARDKSVRKAARRALYKLTQSGVALPEARGAPSGPVVKPLSARPVRAWLSGIDGTGSRAAWILFEGGLGGQLQLCSLILNDEAGVLEAAGGAITRKRLATELSVLREHQKLPWVESDPGRASRLVAEALAIHAAAGTEPPSEFSRWRPFFPAAPPAPEDAPPSPARRTPVSPSARWSSWSCRSSEAGSSIPARSTRRASRCSRRARADSSCPNKSRPSARRRSWTPSSTSTSRRRSAGRWARRLSEMARIFGATGRDEPARLAGATAAGLADHDRPARHLPFARALAVRGLTMGGEVALGRAKLADVSRSPVRTPRQ